MKDLSTFDIDVYHLSLKRHEYQFNIGSSFFAHFANSSIQEGKFQVALTLEKSEIMLQLHFRIDGTARLTCDRSLDMFNYPIRMEKRLILKFGETSDTLSDEIEVIPRDTTTINVAQYIYEYINLAIPMKKLHPRYTQQKGTYEENEDGILIYRSPATDEDAPDTGNEIDPRWQILKKLNNN